MSRQIFFNQVRKSLFNGSLSQSQVEGMEMILDRASAFDIYKADWLAYIFATTYHEVGAQMQPVREGFCSTDQGSINAVTKLFNKGVISRNYALPDPDTGKSYFGRGLVQLTHKANYAKLGKVLGIDLVNNPGLALETKTSVDILLVGMRDGLYTGKKLSDYFGTGQREWKEARRIVNGKDKARLIAGYARKFFDAIGAAGGSARLTDNIVPVPTPRPDVPTPIDAPAAPISIPGLDKPMAKSKTLWGTIAAVGASVVSAFASLHPYAQVAAIGAVVVIAGVGFVIVRDRMRYARQARAQGV